MSEEESKIPAYWKIAKAGFNLFSLVIGVLLILVIAAVLIATVVLALANILYAVLAVLAVVFAAILVLVIPVSALLLLAFFEDIMKDIEEQLYGVEHDDRLLD